MLSLLTVILFITKLLMETQIFRKIMTLTKKQFLMILYKKQAAGEKHIAKISATPEQKRGK